MVDGLLWKWKKIQVLRLIMSLRLRYWRSLLLDIAGEFCGWSTKLKLIPKHLNNRLGFKFELELSITILACTEFQKRECLAICCFAPIHYLAWRWLAKHTCVQVHPCTHAHINFHDIRPRDMFHHRTTKLIIGCAHSAYVITLPLCIRLWRKLYIYYISYIAGYNLRGHVFL